MIRRICVLCFAIVMASCLNSNAQTTQPAADVTVGEMKIRTLQGSNYLYSSFNVTMKEIGKTADDAIPKLLAACKAKGIAQAGSVIFIYHGADGNPATRFTLDIGVPVEDKVAPPEGYQVRAIPTRSQATILFTGPVSEIKAAWMKLMPAVFQAGQQPGGDSREYYLYWEGPESPNNVVMLTIDLAM